MRGDAGGFGDEGGVDVEDAEVAGCEEGADGFEDFQAADVLDGGVGVGEVVSDVGFAGSAQEGVGDGVGEDIGVGVAVEADGVGDVDAA